MALVDSHEYAEQARQIWKAGINAGNGQFMVPTASVLGNWTVVGAGSHRTALRAPTGEVYKVGKDYRNRREHGALQILASRREMLNNIPKFGFYDFSTEFDPDDRSKGKTVVAMEFVENDGTELDDPGDKTYLAAQLECLGVSDDHPDNWRIRAGRAVVIDCSGA